MKTITITRAEAQKMLGGHPVSGCWSARCEAYGEEDDHILAWAWLRGEGPEEGVEIEPGSVRLIANNGTRYRVVAGEPQS